MQRSRRGQVDPFIVMDVMEEARALEAAGRHIIHMEVGQPGTPAPLSARAAVAAAFAAASLGFLSCNWQPARIFMGDVGSAFCGFLIAVLPLAVPREQVPAILPVAVLAMWPFIFDTAYTILRRLRNRENIFAAHRSHLYQRLTIAGWSHRAVASLYGGLSAMSAAIGIAAFLDPSLRQSADQAAVWTILIGSLLLIGLVWKAPRSLVA